MAGLNLYHSNRQEILAERMLETFRRTPLPPLQAETIIVQSRGMARWLALSLAARQQIWANCHCPFPNTFFQQTCRLLNKDIPEQSPYEREAMTWALFELLADLNNSDTDRTVLSYLADGQEIKRFQLAEKTAYLFDQYSVYRPDLILAWENGDSEAENTTEGWQKSLWLSLCKRFGPHHRSSMLHDFLARLQGGDFEPGTLPPRISVFGISSLPPYHLQAYNGLARHIDVNIFLLNPCRHFWDDIYSDRDISRIEKREKKSAETLYLERGNSLLSSMGHLGRDFLSVLHGFDCNEHDFFAGSDRKTLLAKIHNDILELRTRETGESPAAGSGLSPVATDDNSIRINACHSPMREVEVLRDHLLDLFQKDSALHSHEILIMAPDIDEYALLIQAVFNAADDLPKIPFCIADRNISKANSVIETFFSILNLPGSRCTAGQLLQILEEASVRRRFNISEAEIDTIIRWIESTKIRWGIDEEMRRGLGLPAFPENTWRAGLDRLLLGYAMAGNEDRLFKGILPYDAMEGGDTETLGRFLDFCETVFQATAVMRERRTLGGWSSLLLQLLDNLFTDMDNNGFAMNMLRTMIRQLAELERVSGNRGRTGIEVIRNHLQLSISKEESFSGFSAAGFLTNGITCCSMLPMRAIPFKVICLLGMNGASYPRPNQRISFDLMMRNPKRGDRSRRYDDRYLFLETVLSARQQLYISYVGQSVNDDSEKVPSVLVSELMDYIDCFRMENGDSILSRLHGRHRLQPFNPEYFTADPAAANRHLFSYDKENCQAARILAGRNRPGRQPFIDSPLPPPPEEFRRLSITQFLRFYSHPAQFFSNFRLGIFYDKPRAPLDDQEPFSLEGLDRYLLATELFAHRLAGGDQDSMRRIKQAAGELPHGRLGEYAWRKTVMEVEDLCSRLEELTASPVLADCHVDIELEGCRLSGLLTGIREAGLCRFRCAKIKPRDRIQAWLQHLIWNFYSESIEGKRNRTSILAGEDATYVFRPVDGARTMLAGLLRLYLAGLCRPLAFFPGTSLSFAERTAKNADIRESLKHALKAWSGSDYNNNMGEQDEYHDLCFRGANPLDDEFIRLAKKICEPMLAHQEKK